MGGILFDISQETIDSQHSALETIRHRGPLCGVKNFPENGFNVNLGARHFPFTDLTETGHQPISYEDGDCWGVLDGEIYNYREIRRQLSSEGYAFKSTSDTEVALAAYCRWGNKCLQYFRGAFAIVVYHRTLRRFFLARDQVGAKPLYFINQNNCFRVGSEVKQFFSAPGFQARPDRRMLYGYLLSGWCRNESMTIWNGVYELSPGHYIEESLDDWSSGQGLQSRCWFGYNFEVDHRLDFTSAAADYRRLFGEIIQEQTRHDYPAGYRLAGDLGSAVAAIVGGLNSDNQPVKTFSLTSEYNYPDNLHQIRQLRKNFRAEEHLYEFHNRDFLMEFDKMIYANDFPLEFGRGIFSWMLYVTNAACRDRIIIDGEGATQFLCSDLDFYRAYVNRKMYNSSTAGCIAELSHWHLRHLNPWLRLLNKLRNTAFGCHSDDTMAAINKTALLDSPAAEPIFPVIGPESGLTELSLADFRHLTETLLFLDRCAAHGGCELRHPYLDPRLIEFSLKMPFHFKLDKGIPQVILRESFADLLPASLLNAVELADDDPAAGSRWRKRLMHTMLLSNIDDILREPYVNQNELVKIMHRFSLRQRPFSTLIWRLIALNRWKKVFNLS